LGPTNFQQHTAGISRSGMPAKFHFIFVHIKERRFFAFFCKFRLKKNKKKIPKTFLKYFRNCETENIFLKKQGAKHITEFLKKQKKNQGAKSFFRNFAKFKKNKKNQKNFKIVAKIHRSYDL
jgi:hypothetical protein